MVGFSNHSPSTAHMNDKRKELQRLLGKFWDENEIPGDPDASDTASLGAPMDSLTAVEILIEVDKLYGKKLPVNSVIQRGGYKDKAEFIEKLVAQVEKVVKGEAK